MMNWEKSGLVQSLKGQVDAGTMSRRQFLRLATTVGVTLSAASVMMGLPGEAQAQTSNLPFPPSDPAAVKGGTFRVGLRVAKLDDPATYSWNDMANASRPVIEHLTLVGSDNIVRPMLLESWEASDDLKTWTLYLRKGVMWHNGDEFTAEDVVFNILKWADSKTGSSNIGLSTFSALTVETGETDAKGKAVRVPNTEGVEIVDSHTVRLHLSRPVLSVPQDFAEYPTLIVHRNFVAPFSAQPIGTGPFTMVEHEVGKRAILKRVTEMTNGQPFQYWGGEIYLDEIHLYHFESENELSALASGTIDAVSDLPSDQMAFAQSLDNVVIDSVASAATLTCRMQIDRAPFDDIRIRQAIIKSVDNTLIQQLVYPEGGLPAENHHVSPVHPEYFPLPPLVRDVEGAKKLLAEAGHPDGIQLTIDCGNAGGPWEQAVCEAIRDQVKDAGIDLAVNVIPTSRYWEIWTETLFGATNWAHRSLATMTLGLAYRSGVPWNESHFASAEFDAALADAEATVDVEARRVKMEAVQRILQEAGVMLQVLWQPVYRTFGKNVHGYHAHPARQLHLTKVWLS
ncbi:ABC transporter substrate-binding protein [Xinfangfangia sp. CPCC 101601]|uniref:ABC transporter substrate-binding protein n=1 Tax=Pseudogemmobacter lacusdianii TaxID=3069608 RepID=A0ABU0W0S2_9RHOB|nr:ABC transporter substrate-binding protein [Xinfangfangia sp. CPCC 101601]MDQ2067616.1 ABC transporter substrate-binding protein [Xinfangfangia sp. CPCC 101601]